MKSFVPINEHGNAEISPSKLHDLLLESYYDGYTQGKIDAILETAPKFEIAQSLNKGEFCVENEVFIFRATSKRVGGQHDK